MTEDFGPDTTPRKRSDRRKQALREALLGQRQALTPARQRQLNRQLCGHLLKFLTDGDWVHLAAFVPFRGEPDLLPALEVLHQAGRRIHLPQVGDDQSMQFRRWQPGCTMRPNRFGIPEPIEGRPLPAESLDLVLMPLLAFAPSGGRLGMGAGFYDRAFAFRLQRPGSGPALVGAAFSFQQVDSLPLDAWDVPLDGILTERGFHPFSDSL
ncbi:MAG: 5-formyltetrahydrofolate cyclo-ligase [Wenzhouxiangella sp.]